MGFEPTEACASRAFQARRFGRSRTPPNRHDVQLQRVNNGRLSELMAAELVCALLTSRRVRWRSGPVQRMPENQVRSGRKQPSSVAEVCRRSPGRHFSRRNLLIAHRSDAARSPSFATPQLAVSAANSARGPVHFQSATAPTLTVSTSVAKMRKSSASAR